MILKSNAKFKEKLACGLENWHEEFDEVWPEHPKVSKICTLMGCFWSKYIMFELKKYTEVMFDGVMFQNNQIDQIQCENYILPWKQMNSTISKTFYLFSTQSLFLKGIRKFPRKLSSR